MSISLRFNLETPATKEKVTAFTDDLLANAFPHRDKDFLLECEPPQSPEAITSVIITGTPFMDTKTAVTKARFHLHRTDKPFEQLELSAGGSQTPPNAVFALKGL
ncbi:MAG: hypothetical protein K9G62_07400 [Alphaproteobacteria bacterium]|nr:hypothetical protein [Alphaproteobacteria bacterium]